MNEETKQREIKFAYICRNINFDELVHVVLTLGNLENRESETPAWVWTSNCEIIARRQYTGLVDRVGAPVYEGDVIEFSVTFAGTVTGVVEFIHNAFWVRMPDGSRFMPETRKVIGNIYENPELLAPAHPAGA